MEDTDTEAAVRTDWADTLFRCKITHNRSRTWQADAVKSEACYGNTCQMTDIMNDIKKKTEWISM